MGKYKGEELSEYNFNELLLNNLLHISNELAEANRLKQLEIRVIINSSNINMDLRKSFLSEIKDQA